MSAEVKNIILGGLNSFGTLRTLATFSAFSRYAVVCSTCQKPWVPVVYCAVKWDLGGVIYRRCWCDTIASSLVRA